MLASLNSGRPAEAIRIFTAQAAALNVAEDMYISLLCCCDKTLWLEQLMGKFCLAFSSRWTRAHPGGQRASTSRLQPVLRTPILNHKNHNKGTKELYFVLHMITQFSVTKM